MSRVTPDWIDSANKDAGEVMVTDGLGKAMWTPYVSGAGFGRSVYSGSYFTSSSPYIEYSSKSWQVVSQFLFLGSTVVLPKEFIVVGSRNGTSGSADCRLFDYTNSLEIASLTWTSGAVDYYTDDSLINIPTDRAIIEIQIKKSATSASKVRLHSFILT